MGLKYDKIGSWSIIKLDIIKKYASAYSRIMSTRFYHVYIDAFAGSGKHISKDTGVYVPGSPQIALDVTPPFREYHFIDIDSDKVDELYQIAAKRQEAEVYYGDCNKILLEDVFPKVNYKEYKRGLCLLDPYGLHLKWEVIQTAGHMKSIDMFLNFPIADINRNVLRRNSELVSSIDIKRMTDYWGDESWREQCYKTQYDLLGQKLKQDNETIASAFRQRLHEVADFRYVSEPLPMRNSRGAILYYLFFTSQKQLANDIIQDIFNKYRSSGIK